MEIEKIEQYIDKQVEQKQKEIALLLIYINILQTSKSIMEYEEKILQATEITEENVVIYEKVIEFIEELESSEFKVAL